MFICRMGSSWSFWCFVYVLPQISARAYDPSSLLSSWLLPGSISFCFKERLLSLHPCISPEMIPFGIYPASPSKNVEWCLGKVWVATVVVEIHKGLGNSGWETATNQWAPNQVFLSLHCLILLSLSPSTLFFSSFVSLSHHSHRDDVSIAAMFKCLLWPSVCLCSLLFPFSS